MFDIGWSELTLLGVVALVVIGPKDLPKVLRTVGTYTRKARSIAREFQNSVEEMIRESELNDVKKQLDAARNFDLNAEVNKAIDPDGSLRQHLAPPTLPAVTLDQAPTPVLEAPDIDASTGPSPEPLGEPPHPTIHTPIGSEPSIGASSGLDPHPGPHHTDPRPAGRPPLHQHPSVTATVLDPHPGGDAPAAHRVAEREGALPPVAS